MTGHLVTQSFAANAVGTTFVMRRSEVRILPWSADSSGSRSSVGRAPGNLGSVVSTILSLHCFATNAMGSTFIVRGFESLSWLIANGAALLEGTEKSVRHPCRRSVLEANAVLTTCAKHRQAWTAIHAAHLGRDVGSRRSKGSHVRTILSPHHIEGAGPHANS